MVSKEEVIKVIDEKGNEVDKKVREVVDPIVDEKIAPIIEKATSNKNFGFYLIGGVIVVVVVLVAFMAL